MPNRVRTISICMRDEDGAILAERPILLEADKENDDPLAESEVVRETLLDFRHQMNEIINEMLGVEDSNAL